MVNKDEYKTYLPHVAQTEINERKKLKTNDGVSTADNRGVWQLQMWNFRQKSLLHFLISFEEIISLIPYYSYCTCKMKSGSGSG